MNKDATLNDKAGEYQGMDRFEARKKMWEDMQVGNFFFFFFFFLSLSMHVCVCVSV